MDLEELTRGNEALNEQVKLLVKTERRLYGAQRVIETQLRRLEALAKLATRAGRAADPDRVLALGLRTLVDVLDGDQALALLASEWSPPRLAATVTQPGCEPPARPWSAAHVALPVVATPVLLTGGGETTGPLRALLDAVSDYFAPLGNGAAPRRAPALELVVPLQRKSGTPLGVMVLRKLELAVSYHETRISEADLPFVELVRTRVESDVDNVLLYRELEAFAAGLERKVAERTAQLVEASKRAAILTLVAGLSHELNNPIGVILGYAQGLLASATEPLAQRQLAAIERQALRCAQLVKALLSFAENRPMALDIIPPAILLQGVAASVAREAAQRGVTVLIDLPEEDLPSLLVSAESMRETMQQLVMNALDATPAGGTVTLHACEKAQNAVAGVELTVRDTGSGIPHAFLARIFDPFFTTKPPGKGVGLGLSLARRTVESHGGTIGVRSTIGAGTTVVIWLPIAVAEDRDEPQRTAEGGR